MPRNGDKDTPEMDTGQPIAELIEHSLDPHPDMVGRVHRSINRRSLAADGLELSINMMLKTAWEYMQTVLELLPGMKSQDGTGIRDGGINQDKEE